MVQGLKTWVRIAGWPLALIVASITLMPQPDANAFPPPVPVTPAFTYQGVLKSGGGAYNGTADVQFSLWDAPASGVMVAGPVQANGLAISNGMFTADINFGTAQFNGAERWLQIEVHTPSTGGTGPWQALSSRQRFAPVPYALHALSIGGVQPAATSFSNASNQFVGATLDIDANTLFVDAPNNRVGIGTIWPAVPLDVTFDNVTTPMLELDNLSDNTAAMRLITPYASWLIGENRPPDHPGLTNAFYVYDEGVNATRLIIDNDGNVGINNFAPYGKLHVDGGASGTGVWATSAVANGNGVLGYSTAATGSGYGVFGKSDAIGGAGVVGYATASGPQNAGVAGRTESTGGSGVKGFATATTGSAVGVYGESWGPAGRGVNGRGTDGVYGYSPSPNGRAIVGWAPADGPTYGVFGQSDSATSWAVWAQGRLGALGTKSFRIDHPDDPANKYLLHYSAESDEVINFYSGKVMLNGAGEAVVNLPAYFAKINKDPRYTLTAIGAAMPNLHIADEISDAMLAAEGPCSFRIAGGAPNAKVSWRVEAVRNDLWMRANGAPVEMVKAASERGRYLDPALYGQGPEKAMFDDAVRPEPDRASVDAMFRQPESNNNN